MVALVWLNGPGIRWLLPMVAGHFLEKKSMTIEMEVRGSVAGGLSFHEVHLAGGPIVDLRVSSVQPLYQLHELLDGKVQGIRVDGVMLEMDLDRNPVKAAAAEKSPPFDIRKVIELMRANQKIADGYEVDVQVQSLRVHRNEALVASSEGIRLSHRAGDDVWQLVTGVWQLPQKKSIPAQTVAITWSQDEVGIDQFRIDDTLRCEELTFATPEDLRPLLQVRLGWGATIFRLQTTENFERIDVRMSGAPFPLTQVQPYLASPVPVQGNIAAFDLWLEPKHLPIFGEESPPAMLFDGNVQTTMAAVQWRTWKLDKVDLILSKSAEKADLLAKIAGYEGIVNAKAALLWNQNPSRAEDWQRASMIYEVDIPELKDLLKNLAPELGIKPPENPVPPPASSLRLNGSLRVDGAALGPIEAQVNLRSAAANLPELNLTARSPNGKIFTAEGGFGPLSVKGAFDHEGKSYEAESSAKELDPQVYQPWVTWAGIELPKGLNASIRWQGTGELKDARHRGQAEIESFSWKRENSEELTATGQANYDWPQNASVDNFKVKLGDQQARMNLSWAGDRLELRELELRKKELRLVSGEASIPMAGSVKSLREFLQQKEHLTVRLTSEELPLTIAEHWMKPGEQLPVTGMAKIDLQISGTPADPVIAGNLQLKNAKSRADGTLPAVDLMLDLQTKEQQLALSGLLLTARTSPVQLKAEMPFRPGAWAEDFSLLQKESIQARVDIPALDLARFQDLVPQVKQLAGTLNGNVIIDGTVSAPRINGSLAMKNFSARLPQEKVPPMTEGSMNLTFTDRIVTLEKLNLTVAGGTIAIKGKADLTQPAKPALDFTVRGDALPLWRDDAVIARANANLRIAGPWEAVRTSGEIGIVDSLLYKDFEIIPIGKPFTLPQAASLPSLDANLSNKAESLPQPFANWPLALQIKTSDPFLVRGNLARGSITADVTIAGTLGNPQPVGEVVISELTAALPLSKLTISSGKVRFTAASGLDPVLDIRGASRVSNYDVSLYAYGPVSAPKILLTSEPPLPENEIMTLLATGTTTEGLSDQDTAQSKATQLLIEEFRRGRLPMGQKLMPLLSKLENVELAVGEPDPYTGRKFASAKMPLFSRYFLYGAVDALGRTRSFLMFEVKLK